jgi:hypothetical protein
MLLATSVVVLMAAMAVTPALGADATSNAIAQSGGLTDILTGGTPAAGATATASATIAPTVGATPTPAATAAPATAITLTLPVTMAAALSNTLISTSTAPFTDTTSGNIAPAPEGVVAGTVIANRTEALVRFFAEGNTYDLAGLRSAGLALSRPSNVLNLYNCDATAGVAQQGCYWDPYLLERDGFYEIVAGKDAGALQSLILREAGAPPENQVWIQNRAGRDEEVYFGTQMRDLPLGAVEQFGVEAGGVGVFYLRTCVTTQDGASVCEWSSHSAEPGGYYALVDQSRPGGVAGTTISSLSLQAVLGAVQASTDSTPAQAAVVDAPQTVCKLAVPALNVRSGPGLGFDIVKKVRSTDAEVATIVVTGRTTTGDWLRVDETIAPGGWVIAGSEYLACDGDVNALPPVAESELPATPTPLPVEVLPAGDAATGSTGQQEEGLAEGAGTDTSATGALTNTTATTSTATSLPIGTAMLTVQNAFDREVRFTLDQRFRLEPGSSEFDLAPGQSVNIIVYAGPIPFTASSPWQGLSGNTAIEVAEGETRGVYLVFFYDEVDKKWYLAPV